MGMVLRRVDARLVAKCLFWLLTSSSSCMSASVKPGALSAAPCSTCRHVVRDVIGCTPANVQDFCPSELCTVGTTSSCSILYSRQHSDGTI